jgi:CheY-like chemotaxis protein
MKVLVVEDNATARFVLKATLEALGHEVTLTENGRAGLDAWNNGDFRVVVSDWMMPETDGLALCRAIRATTRDYYTSFILLTALGGKQN